MYLITVPGPQPRVLFSLKITFFPHFCIVGFLPHFLKEKERKEDRQRGREEGRGGKKGGREEGRGGRNGRMREGREGGRKGAVSPYTDYFILIFS